MTRPGLLTAIRKQSNYHQTAGLEVKHLLDNQFASKNTFYPYHSLMARFVLFAYFVAFENYPTISHFTTLIYITTFVSCKKL